MIKGLIKKEFSGREGEENIYQDFENGHVGKDNPMLSIVRASHGIDRDEPIYVIIFYKGIRKKEGWFSDTEKLYYFSCCVTERGISFAGIDASREEEDVYYAISWDDIEDVGEVYPYNRRYEEGKHDIRYMRNDFAWEIFDELCEEYLKIYHKDGYCMCIPAPYINGHIEYMACSIIGFIYEYKWEQEKEDKRREKEDEILEKIKELRPKMDELYDKKDYEEVVRIMDKENLWDIKGSPIVIKGMECLLKLGRKLEADRAFLDYERDFLSIKEEIYTGEFRNLYEIKKIEYLKAKSIKEGYEGKWYDASLTFAEMEKLDAADKVSAKKNIEENYTKYIQNFETLPYQERKVITMTNTDHLFKSDNLTLLWMNNLPAEIKFPITHPKKDHTYICHPYDNRLYLPIEDYEEVLLNDRINEYCYLMQCLGATTIRIQNKKEESLNEDRESARNIHGEVSYKILEASGNYETNSKKGEGRNSKYTFAREQHFNPSKKPYIPDGLIWFPHEVSWQRLATQRMSGGILKYGESVSSSENRVVTSNELQDINAEIKVLFAKMKGGIKRESNYEISMNEDQEWEIFVEFKPIEEFDASVDFSDIAETVQIEEVEELPENIFTEEEKQYMDEVRYMLEDDDKIDEKESRILERFRQKFNLSEDRANELKNILLSAVDLNSQELEYLKEYETFIQDGEIKERERRLLNRVANLLGISEDRALEIENKYNIKNQ